MDYDKAIEFVMDPVTISLFTPKELRITGKVLMVQALLKDGKTVDAATEYQVGVEGDRLQVRAYRGKVN